VQPGRGLKSRARNHLQANGSLQFRFEMVIWWPPVAGLAGSRSRSGLRL